LSDDKKALFNHLYPLAKLKLDQAMLHLDDEEVYPTRALKKALMSMARRFSSRTDYTKAKGLLAEVAQLSELFDANRDPLADSKGSVVERAYIAENDDSAQPYYVYVPKKYEKEKKWPLFIFLHGWVPETSKIDPWLCPSDVLPIADELGFLYLQRDRCPRIDSTDSKILFSRPGADLPHRRFHGRRRGLDDRCAPAS
jgi:hypothetical protein